MRDYVRELSEYKAVSLPVTFSVVTRFLNGPSRVNEYSESRAPIVQDLNTLKCALR